MARSPRPSFSTFVEEHREGLVRFLEKRLGNQLDAADVAQEAYLRLFRSERFEELENPRAFLYRIAANLAVNRNLQEGRVAKQRQQLALAAQRDPGRAGRAGPEATLDARELEQQVIGILGELPPDCRRALVLHRFTGRTYREIAVELGVSRSMVEKHLIRALKHLRRRLREFDEES